MPSSTGSSSASRRPPDGQGRRIPAAPLPARDGVPRRDADRGPAALAARGRGRRAARSVARRRQPGAPADGRGRGQRRGDRHRQAAAGADDHRDRRVRGPAVDRGPDEARCRTGRRDSRRPGDRGPLAAAAGLHRPGGGAAHQRGAAGGARAIQGARRGRARLTSRHATAIGSACTRARPNPRPRHPSIPGGRRPGGRAMPKLTYAENPVHPVLNDYPAALVPTSVAFDLLHLFTRRTSFKVASFFTLLFALLTGGAAAATGYQDYREIPEGTDAKRLANAHGMLNAGVMGAIVLQLLLRSTGRVGIFVRLLNLASAAGLITSSWYGMHLVYRHGLRVRGVDPLEGAPDAGTDTGKPFADRLESLVEKVPD